jgi:hypothetical protein
LHLPDILVDGISKFHSHIDEVKKAVGKRIEVTRNPGEATSTVEIMD